MEINLENIWKISSEEFKIQQVKEEWLWFLSLLPKYNKLSILEIGCYDGGSTASLAHFADTLITIDINNPPRFDPKRIKDFCKNYMYIGNDSHDLSNLDHIRTFKFDLIFIDGDHTYEGVKRDYEIYSALCKVNGIIAFHDIIDSESHRQQNCFVGKFWDEVKQGQRFQEKITTTSWAGIGILINK